MNDEKQVKKIKFQKTLLILGLSLVLIGILLSVFIQVGFSAVKHYALRPIIVLLLSLVAFYRGFVAEKRTVPLFFGLFLFLCGIIILLADSSVIPFSIYQLWPVMVISCALSLFVSNLVVHKKIAASVLVPSIIILGMGIVFLLFALDVITVSIRTLVAQWWPILVVFFGMGLVILFFHNQRGLQNGKNKLFDDDDEAIG